MTGQRQRPRKHILAVAALLSAAVTHTVVDATTCTTDSDCTSGSETTCAYVDATTSQCVDVSEGSLGYGWASGHSQDHLLASLCAPPLPLPPWSQQHARSIPSSPHRRPHLPSSTPSHPSAPLRPTSAAVNSGAPTFKALPTRPAVSTATKCLRPCLHRGRPTYRPFVRSRRALSAVRTPTAAAMNRAVPRASTRRRSVHLFATNIVTLRGVRTRGTVVYASAAGFR